MAKFKKNLLYKIGLPVATAGVIVVPLATVISCGVTKDNPGISWQFASHNIVQITEDTPDGISDVENEQAYFQTPQSTAPSSNTGYVAEVVAGMTLAPFRIVMKSNDQNKFDANGRIVAITPNRDVAIRFEMASKVTFEFMDNTQVIFDNDTDDDFTTKDTQGHDIWHYSINGQKLQDTLQKGGIKNIRFEMRSDLGSHNWIQQLTGKKLSSIKADDLWRGLLLNVFSNGVNRADSLGIPLQPNKNDPNEFSVQSIDQTFLSFFPNALKNSFTTGTATDGRGLFFSPIYGLDGQALLDSIDNASAKSKFIPSENEFVLPFASNSNISGITAKSFWDANFVKAQGFTAISDTEIQKIMIKKDAVIKSELQTSGFTSAQIDTLTNSKLYKSGFYQWQHAFRDEQFVGGKYYIASSSTKVLSVKWNQDYVDPRWLNQKNSSGKSTVVQEFRVKYIQKSEASNAVIANEYKNGTSATALFKNFSIAQQIDILRGLKQWGVSFIRPFTSSKGIGDYGAFSPIPFLSKNGNTYFNNNFSKLMFGDYLSNYKDNSTPSEDLWKYQMTGNGLQFRSNFYALFNGTGWFKASGQSGDGVIAWPNMFAPEGTIGKDANGNNLLLTDYLINPEAAAQNGVDDEKVMAYNVSNIKSDGSIETHALPYADYLTSAVGSDFNALGPSHNPDVTLPLKNSTDHYSPFEWVKKNVTESIDKMFGPLQFDSAGKPIVNSSNELTFEMPYGRGLTSPDYNGVYNKFKQYLLTIDPRLNVVAAMTPGKEDGTKDATTIVDKWTDDFDSTATPAQGKPNYSFIDRLQAGGSGYSFSSFKLANAYLIDSPASQMFDGAGYLQSGVLLTLSYLSNHISDVVDKSEILKPLKPVIDFFKNQFNEYKTKFNQDVQPKLQSSHASDIMDALNDPNFTFENLYKSTPENIATNDFAGFFGLDKLWPLFDIKGDDKLSADLIFAQSSVGAFADSIGTKFDEQVFGTYTTEDKLLLMQTYESLFGQNFSVFGSGVGDRRVINFALQKTWFADVKLDKYSHVDLSRARVDMDHTDQTNPYSDIVLNNFDENGKPIVY